MKSDAAATVAFCERWLKKAEGYDAQTLDGAFDCFFSLFVAFNRLYSHLNRHALHPVKHDSTQATTGYCSAVGARDLLASLERDQGAADIVLLRDLIRPASGEFFLISEERHGAPDYRKNEKLYDDLGSTSSAARANAVLKYLYHVRCNMFHGAKDFVHRQLRIVQPASRVLERAIRVGLDRVAADAV